MFLPWIDPQTSRGICPFLKVKRTSSRRVAMSAFDPKRTCPRLLVSKLAHVFSAEKMAKWPTFVTSSGRNGQLDFKSKFIRLSCRRMRHKLLISATERIARHGGSHSDSKRAASFAAEFAKLGDVRTRRPVWVRQAAATPRFREQGGVVNDNQDSESKRAPPLAGEELALVAKCRRSDATTPSSPAPCRAWMVGCVGMLVMICARAEQLLTYRSTATADLIGYQIDTGGLSPSPEACPASVDKTRISIEPKVLASRTPIGGASS